MEETLTAPEIEGQAVATEPATAILDHALVRFVFTLHRGGRAVGRVVLPSDNPNGVAVDCSPEAFEQIRRSAEGAIAEVEAQFNAEPAAPESVPAPPQEPNSI